MERKIKKIKFNSPTEITFSELRDPELNDGITNEYLLKTKAEIPDYLFQSVAKFRYWFACLNDLPLEYCLSIDIKAIEMSIYRDSGNHVSDNSSIKITAVKDIRCYEKGTKEDEEQYTYEVNDSGKLDKIIKDTEGNIKVLKHTIQKLDLSTQKVTLNQMPQISELLFFKGKKNKDHTLEEFLKDLDQLEAAIYDFIDDSQESRQLNMFDNPEAKAS